MSSNIIESQRQRPTDGKTNAQLVTQIKSAIENHYSNLPRKMLNEKVRTEVIPIIIGLFFEGPSPVGKENCGTVMEGMGRGLAGINCEQIFGKKEQIPVQKLVNKTVAFCRLVQIIEGSRLKQGNERELFEIYHQSRDRASSNLKWLSRYVQLQRRRTAVASFYRNYLNSKDHLQSCKKLHKLYLLKLAQHFTSLSSPILTKEQSSVLEQWQLAKQRCLNRGLAILDGLYGGRMRQAVGAIRRYNYGNNPWRDEWVRHMVYRTPANLQTSLWRLINYASSQQKQPLSQPLPSPTEPQPTDRRESTLSENKSILLKIEQANDSQIEAMLFTKEQKVELLWKQLEFVHKLIELESILEAFSALQGFTGHCEDGDDDGDMDKDQGVVKLAVEEEMELLIGQVVDGQLKEQGSK